MKRRRGNPRLRRAWNKRPKYQPSFTNMGEYTNFQVKAGVNVEELARGEPVIWHDSLLMLKRLGGFYQGIDKWHKLDLPFLLEGDLMYFTGSMYVFFRNRDGLVLRTGIYQSKETAYKAYQSGRLHWFIPYKEEVETFQDDLTGLKPHPRPRPVPKEE